MTNCIGFPPVATPDARVLILGSLPGAESLRLQQYYGKPANRFWWIMGHIADAAPDLPYAERLQRLIAARFALWDVCAAATRPGSLDSSIEPSSVVPNDFTTFLAAHRSISLICFNGATAAKLFCRLVLPHLSPVQARLRRATLPSTSPAHAGMPADQKLAAWRASIGAPDAAR